MLHTEQAAQRDNPKRWNSCTFYLCFWLHSCSWLWPSTLLWPCERVCVVRAYPGRPVCVILVLLLFSCPALQLNPGSNISTSGGEGVLLCPTIASQISCHKYSGPFCFPGKHYGTTSETVLNWSSTNRRDSFHFTCADKLFITLMQFNNIKIFVGLH